MKKNIKNETPEVKKCKKCQRVLPAGYKYNNCESCRGKQAESAKKGIIGVGGTLLSVGLLVLTRGKFGGKKS